MANKCHFDDIQNLPKSNLKKNKNKNKKPPSNNYSCLPNMFHDDFLHLLYETEAPDAMVLFVALSNHDSARGRQRID